MYPPGWEKDEELAHAQSEVARLTSALDMARDKGDDLVRERDDLAARLEEKSRQLDEESRKGQESYQDAKKRGDESVRERDRTIQRLQMLLNEAEGERDRLKAAQEGPEEDPGETTRLRNALGLADERVIGAMASVSEAHAQAEKAESDLAHAQVVQQGLRQRISDLEGKLARSEEERAKLERERGLREDELSVLAALSDGLKDETQRQAENILRLIAQLVDARAERDHWRDDLRALQRLDDGRRRLLDAMDDLIIDISDGHLMRTPPLQALPPWRAAMMARLGEKASVTLQNGTVEQLVAEARRVGGDGVLGDWWLR